MSNHQQEISGRARGASLLNDAAVQSALEEKKRRQHSKDNPLAQVQVQSEPDTAPCQHCKKSFRSTYCHFCVKDLCLNCSRTLHCGTLSSRHPRVIMSKKQEYLVLVHQDNTPEYAEYMKLFNEVQQLRRPAASISSAPTFAPAKKISNSNSNDNIANTNTTADASHAYAMKPSASSSSLIERETSLFEDDDKTETMRPRMSLSWRGSVFGSEKKDSNDQQPAPILPESTSDVPVSVLMCFVEADEEFVQPISKELSAANRLVHMLRKNLGNDAEWLSLTCQDVESCDYFVCVLSPQSIKNAKFNEILDIALRNNKQIVPIVSKDIEFTQVRSELSKLNWIFFSQNPFEDSVKLLRKSVEKEIRHAQMHTTLLRHALAWKQSNFEASRLLVHPADQKKARDWLFGAAIGRRPSPSKVMLGFITNSLGMVTNIHLTPSDASNEKALEQKCASVFISFSHSDLGFVQNLDDKLKADAHKTFVKYDHVEASPEWLNDTHSMIDQADTFVCVLSPEAVVSEMRQWELDRAIKQGKRIIPLVRNDIDFALVRSELSSLSWIFARESHDDFAAAFRNLRDTLNTDLYHVITHTYMLQRAIAWEQHKRDKKYLLSGDDLKRGQDWLLESALGLAPHPTSLVLEFYSRSETNRDQCVIL